MTDSAENGILNAFDDKPQIPNFKEQQLELEEKERLEEGEDEEEDIEASSRRVMKKLGIEINEKSDDEDQI